MGYEVLAVNDGESGWLAFLAERYPIVISDWGLPGLSGIELCQKIRARKSAQYTYFITITSFVGKEKMNQAMEAGVDDFISKPIDFDSLAIRLRVADRILDFHKQIVVLQGLLPICMYCKKIRNDGAYWETVETYFAAHTGADFTHSLCPTCYVSEVLPEFESLGISEGLDDLPKPL